jgi:hypothetical protein
MTSGCIGQVYSVVILLGSLCPDCTSGFSSGSGFFAAGFFTAAFFGGTFLTAGAETFFTGAFFTTGAGALAGFGLALTAGLGAAGFLTITLFFTNVILQIGQSPGAAFWTWGCIGQV